ncbi:MAG TPA: nucleotide exchange factor GrpE [Candidatus Paceibacterota bacterium]
MEHSDEEEFIAEEDSEAGSAAVGKLRDKLKKAVEEKQEYLEGWQRARADFANFKREEALMHHDKEARIKSDMVESLIPTLDTFEMALKHTKGDESKGLQIIYKQFLNSLKSMGVEKYGAPGDTFNPHTYEALREVATSDQIQDHTVESVERSGYAAGEKIIRPAQVSVYVYKQ